jgi:ribonuclease VapC
MTIVHDASCLLALAFREPGAEIVRANLRDSLISSVNWSEFVQKVTQHDGNVTPLSRIVEALGVTIVPFTVSTAELAARLYPQTKPLGLSLGDRACLALALERQCDVYTADSAWSKLQLSIDIRVIR